MFDGKLDRIAADGDLNFGDFSMLPAAWTAFYNNGALDGPRYNELGDEDPNGKYLTGVDFILDDVYTVDTIRVFLDEMENIKDLCVDGFDILVRETEDDKWTTIYSVSNLATEAKYKVHEGANGQQTAYVEGTFAPVKAGFIRFSLTAPRSALSQYATGGDAHRFWRITELELYEAKAGEDTTTAAPDTTTTAPTQTPDTADVLPLVCIGLMLAAAACLTLRKKFN